MSESAELVKELFSTLKDFLYRDIFYVLGGVTVLLSIILTFDIPIKFTGWTGVYLAIFGYVVGYVLQEVVSIIGLTTTAYREPHDLIKKIGHRFAPSEDWEALPPPNMVDLSLLRKCLDEHCEDSCQKRINRTVNLKQVCSSMGSSLSVTTILLFIAAYLHYPNEKWFIPLAVASAVLSIALIAVNWLKQTQENIMRLEVNKTCTTCQGNAIKSS
ncbi:MAG: hypothetical protein KME48_19255 [Candidatus Thiodiazotropha sp. (ex Ctena orbiculata)]|nr:hypothetical protein [Candidatus Thiodiazotropha taylori]MBT3037026.1 hypothetical protein [Candidatus Thiodiazotropha taylori]